MELHIYGDSVDMNETQYWNDRCALIDPDCVSILTGTFSFTVPAGEYRYLTASWNTAIGAGQRVEARNPSNPVMLPAGTVLTGLVSGTYAVLVNPFAVTAHANPRQKFHERTERLKTLTLHTISVQIAAGAARGTLAETNFPTDFTDGLVAWYMNFDCSWGGLYLYGAGVPVATINLGDEISDDHQNRVSVQFPAPFAFKLDPTNGVRAVRARSASVSGNATETALAGVVTVGYYKLPADW